MTRYSVALTLIILASFPAHSECIDIWDETTTKRANELRGIALNMLDAEGDNCIDIKKRTERSACQCSYRQQDLIKFRSAYKAFLTDYPQYNGKGLCFTDTNNQGAWINLVAYNKMEKWCLNIPRFNGHLKLTKDEMSNAEVQQSQKNLAIHKRI